MATKYISGFHFVCYKEMESRDLDIVIAYFWKQQFPLILFSFAKEKTCENINFSLKDVTSVGNFVYILRIFSFIVHIYLKMETM